MAKQQQKPPRDVRWYQCRGTDDDTRQVKFAGVPADQIEALITAVKTVFPDLRSY